MAQRNTSDSGFKAKNVVIWLGVGFLALFLFSGGSDGEALDSVRSALSGTPTYSVILADAKEEGNFFKDYYQKFTVVVPENEDVKETTTDWLQTSEKSFESTLPFLGMTIFSKQDGKETDEAAPPGYEYIGNPHYGHWGGGGFWVFYGQYRLLSDLFGGGRVSRQDYDTYRNYRSSGKPYYGKNNQYGTAGSFTKKKNPSFYERHNSKSLQKKASFSNKVNSRIGRNSVAVRSRSTKVGK